MNMPATRKRKRAPQRGYVLVVVLGMSVVTLSVGMAYLEAHSSVLPEAVNRVTGSRAKYLAGSGVELAARYLTFAPDSVKDGDYWRGANGLRIDGSNDYMDVAVTEDATMPGVFTVQAVGIAHDMDGRPRGKASVSARILKPRDLKWRIPFALLSDHDLTVIGQATITGKTHANGRIRNSGRLTDTVSATGSISWLALLIPKPELLPNFESFSAPRASMSMYENYVINETAYSAVRHDPSAFTQAHANAYNSVDMSATNIGRIIRIRGGADIQTPVTVYGTLLVDGDLRIKGSGTLTVHPEPGFPALVVKDDIRLDDNRASLVANGSVIARRIDLRGKSQVSVVIRGAVITDSDDAFKDPPLLGGSVEVEWDEEKATFWNLERTADPDPVTILEWTEG